MKIISRLLFASIVSLSLPAFAASETAQDACLEAASKTLTAALQAADDRFAAAALRCGRLPNVDVVNACVNDAVDALTSAKATANAIYAAEVAACLR